MESIIVGEFLKSLRKEKGLTQEEVAEKLFLSAKTISRWENGGGIPDISIITNVADLYGVTVDEILRGKRGSIEQNNKKNLKFDLDLVVNKLLKRFNNFFIVSISFFCFFSILGLILIGLFILLNSASVIIFIIGAALFTIGIIFSNILIIIANKDCKNNLNLELEKLDNEDDKEYISNKVRNRLKQKSFIILDIILFGYLIIRTITLFVSLFVIIINGLYNGIEYSTFDIGILLLIFGLTIYSIIAWAYIKFRKYDKIKFINKIFKHLKFKNIIYIYSLVFLILTILCFFKFDIYQYKYAKDTGELLTTKQFYSGQLSLKLYFEYLNYSYLYRAISIVLLLVAIILIVLSIKFKKIWVRLIAAIFGIGSQLIIPYDFSYKDVLKSTILQTSYSNFNYLYGIIFLVGFLLCMIIEIIYKRKTDINTK